MSGSTTAVYDRITLQEALRTADGPADERGEFPEQLWSALLTARAPLWSIPAEQGGDGLGRIELLERYADVAEGSLTAAFILSQHDAAVRRLLSAPKSAASRLWLGRISEGTAFTTIGVSQLTTSRRLGSRALRAEVLSDGRHRLSGSMPWVTAAERADVFVTGAVRDDGLQLLFVLSANRPGVSVRPAFALAALGASRTSEVVCDGAIVEEEDWLAPPAADVMAHASAAGTGGLETSALALGQARAAIRAMENDPAALDELAEPIRALDDAWRAAWAAMTTTANAEPGAPSSGEVRGKANDLALRCTQAYLTARRGRGFLLGDPAQRWARQALFFLVWSCPTPVANAAIRDLAGLCSL